MNSSFLAISPIDGGYSLECKCNLRTLQLAEHLKLVAVCFSSKDLIVSMTLLYCLFSQEWWVISKTLLFKTMFSFFLADFVSFSLMLHSFYFHLYGKTESPHQFSSFPVYK